MQEINLKEFTLSNKTYSFYTSIKELKEKQWHKAQMFLLYESGIGSNMESINEHYARIFQHLTLNQPDLASDEAFNLFSNWNAFINGINYKTLAITCFIRSVNGIEPELKTDDDYLKLHKQLIEDGITNGHIEEILSSIKKKLLTN